MTDPLAEAEELIGDARLMAHLATCRDGRPHVAPVWYDYVDGTLEIVTTGRKLANVRANPKVAVSIQRDEDGYAQWMVTLFGTATVIDDEEETAEATRRINRKYGADETAWAENVLVRIDVGSASVSRY